MGPYLRGAAVTISSEVASFAFVIVGQTALFFYRSGQVVAEIRSLEKTLMASTSRLDNEILALRSRMHEQEGLVATLKAYDTMRRMDEEYRRDHPEAE